MGRFFKLIGILFGIFISLTNVWTIPIGKIPFAVVNLTTDGIITKLANETEQHENEYSVGSNFSLKCSFAITGNGYTLDEIIFQLNKVPIGKLNASDHYEQQSNWKDSAELYQNWALNVFPGSNQIVGSSMTSYSLWIQPLSSEATGNYSCLVWLKKEETFLKLDTSYTYPIHKYAKEIVGKAKYVSNMFPIRIKPIE